MYAPPLVQTGDSGREREAAVERVEVKRVFCEMELKNRVEVLNLLPDLTA